MDVRGDRVRARPGGDGRFGHRVIEATAAVAHVEKDAALLGLRRRRQQLALLHDIGELAREVGGAGKACVSTSPGRSMSRIWLISSGVSTPPM